MIDIPNLPPAFSLSRLKLWGKVLPKLRKIPQEMREHAAKRRAAYEKLIPPGFAWAELYELQAKELHILSFASTGKFDQLEAAIQAGQDINAFMMDMAIDESEDDDDFSDWAGGYKGLFKESDVIAIQFAISGSLTCLGIYGYYLNDLVEKVRNGNDPDNDAFFKAVSIDRTVLTCPTFAARLARAEMFSEKRFMQRLKRAVKGKPHDSLLIYQDLRFFIQLFHEAKVLSSLSMEQADLLFIQELKLYSEGDDPARSLARFIQRWRQDRKLETT